MPIDTATANDNITIIPIGIIFSFIENIPGYEINSR
jgi:hypothetical protein